MSRRLIVNADDLGLCHGVNRGIFRAAEDGVVTSASLMVRWPAASEAADWARRHPDVSIGLHVDLGEWVCRDGDWIELYHVLDATDAGAVAHEVAAQLSRFERLVGRPPTHLDSHQHVHRSDPVRSLVVAAGARLGVPVREAAGGVRYCGSFYGQSGSGQPYPEGITVDALTALLDEVPDGVTELACHPGDDTLDDLDSPYHHERAVERRLLCDPTVPALLRQRGIALCSFADLADRGELADGAELADPARLSGPRVAATAATSGGTRRSDS